MLLYLHIWNELWYGIFVVRIRDQYHNMLYYMRVFWDIVVLFFGKIILNGRYVGSRSISGQRLGPNICFTIELSQERGVFLICKFREWSQMRWNLFARAHWSSWFTDSWRIFWLRGGSAQEMNMTKSSVYREAFIGFCKIDDVIYTDIEESWTCDWTWETPFSCIRDVDKRLPVIVLLESLLHIRTLVKFNAMKRSKNIPF